MQKNKQLNVPNMLSIFRLCMVPVFVATFFMADPDKPRYGALIVYIVAQGTDALDGYIARKYNLITRLGRVLDPLADKLMSFTVITCLAIQNSALWWVVVIFFLKESMMGIGALVLYKHVTDVPPSNFLGKLSTIYFYCVFIVVLLFQNLPPIGLLILLAVGVALTLVAFVTYVVSFIKQLRKPKLDSGKDEA